MHTAVERQYMYEKGRRICAKLVYRTQKKKPALVHRRNGEARPLDTYWEVPRAIELVKRAFAVLYTNNEKTATEVQHRVVTDLSVNVVGAHTKPCAVSVARVCMSTEKLKTSKPRLGHGNPMAKHRRQKPYVESRDAYLLLLGVDPARHERASTSCSPTEPTRVHLTTTDDSSEDTSIRNSHQTGLKNRV